MSTLKRKINDIAYKIICLLLVFSFLVTETTLKVCSQSTTKCTSTTIKPLQNPIQVPVTLGDTNNDSTFEGIDQFADLDIPLTPNPNTLSICIHKNNSARILNINSKNGSLSISPSTIPTDTNEITPASIRGICSFSPTGNEIYFPGIKPDELGFDRIFSYKISDSIPSSFTKASYFLPVDLPTSVDVTPNGKFLVYLQANTSNDNLASIQSVEIQPDRTLKESFVGQDLAQTVSAGTYLEISKRPLFDNSKFVYGVFSNLHQSKGGSGNGFGIFKTNQENGVNTILAEFKKDDTNFPLPSLFKISTFGGFSGFKLIQRDKKLFLLISYFEIDPGNPSFPNFSYISKLVLLKINIANDLSNSVILTQGGKPLSTVFKTTPCNENNFHGISGPIWINNGIIYVANNNKELTKGENYFASYFIDWNLVANEAGNTEIMRLTSPPQKTSSASERNTDIVLTPDGMFAYIATSGLEGEAVNIYGYSLEQKETSCSSLKESLIKAGLCDISTSPKLISNAPQPSPSPAGTVNQTPITSPITPQTQGQQPISIFPISEDGRPPELLPSGRPPKFTSPGRPPKVGTGLQETNKKTIQPPLPPPMPLKEESTQPQEPYTTQHTEQRIESFQESQPTFQEPLPDIVLIPVEPPVVQDLSLGIDTKSLDLSGTDQIVISPTIPYIIFSSPPLETPNIEPAQEGNGSSSSGLGNLPEMKPPSENNSSSNCTEVTQCIKGMLFCSNPNAISQCPNDAPIACCNTTSNEPGCKAMFSDTCDSTFIPCCVIPPFSPDSVSSSSSSSGCISAQCSIKNILTCPSSGTPQCPPEAPIQCCNTTSNLPGCKAMFSDTCDSTFIPCCVIPSSSPSKTDSTHAVNAKCKANKVICTNNSTPSCQTKDYKPSCINNLPTCCTKTSCLPDLLVCPTTTPNAGFANPASSPTPTPSPETTPITPEATPVPTISPLVEPTPESPPGTTTASPEPTPLNQTFIETDISNCCSCIEGELRCQDNTLATCEGGTVYCANNTSNLFACCKETPGGNVCTTNEPTIKCYTQQPTGNMLLRKKGKQEVKSKKDTLKQTAMNTSQTKGAIKAGSGGYLIYLKENKKIKLKDLKNITYIVTDDKNNSTSIPGESYLIDKKIILAKLSFPSNAPSGEAELIALLNKIDGKKDVIAKGKINIFDPVNLRNVFQENEIDVGLPEVQKVQGRITNKLSKDERIVRLTFIGKNFASKLIKINDTLYIAPTFKSHTTISFGDEKDIKVLRTRVLRQGDKLEVIVKYSGKELNQVPFTISTPKGQFFSKNLGVKLFSNPQDRSIKLELDSNKPIIDKKN